MLIHIAAIQKGVSLTKAYENTKKIIIKHIFDSSEEYNYKTQKNPFIVIYIIFGPFWLNYMDEFIFNYLLSSSSKSQCLILTIRA